MNAHTPRWQGPTLEAITDIELYWLDPEIDDGLDLSESTRRKIGELMWALHRRGHPATPAVIATALSRLGCAPVEEEQLVTLLIMNWKRLLDEVDPLDPQALHAYWRLAPVREHPLCYYLAGMIHTLTFVRGWWGRDVDREPARSPRPHEERPKRDVDHLTG